MRRVLFFQIVLSILILSASALSEELDPLPLSCRYTNPAGVHVPQFIQANFIKYCQSVTGFDPSRNQRQIQVDGPLLLVTHASILYDYERIAKPAIETLIRNYRMKNNKVAFLVGLLNSSFSGWYTDSRLPPDLVQFSVDGEHTISVSGEVTVVGGSWGLCHQMTIGKLIENFEFYSERELIINLPVGAIYYTKEDQSEVLLSTAIQEFGLEKIIKELVIGLSRSPQFANFAVSIFIDNRLVTPALGNSKKKVRLNLLEL